MASNKHIKSAVKSPKSSSSSAVLQVKTKRKDDDWYEAAYKRFSISLNRNNQQRDPLASVMPSETDFQ